MEKLKSVKIFTQTFPEGFSINKDNLLNFTDLEGLLVVLKLQQPTVVTFKEVCNSTTKYIHNIPADKIERFTEVYG